MALSADAVQVGPWNSVRYDLPAQECANDELNSMENCRIGPAGWLASRKGTLSYQSASAIGGAPTVTMVAEFKPTATTTHVVIVAGTAIYKYAGGWSAITGSVTVTAGDDNTWEYADCNGTLVATNGVDTNAWKWTGSGNASDLDDDSRFSKGKHVAWFDNRCWIGNVDAASGPAGNWGTLIQRPERRGRLPASSTLGAESRAWWPRRMLLLSTPLTAYTPLSPQETPIAHITPNDEPFKLGLMDVQWSHCLMTRS